MNIVKDGFIHKHGEHLQHNGKDIGEKSENGSMFKIIKKKYNHHLDNNNQDDDCIEIKIFKKKIYFNFFKKKTLKKGSKKLFADYSKTTSVYLLLYNINNNLILFRHQKILDVLLN